MRAWLAFRHLFAIKKSRLTFHWILVDFYDGILISWFIIIYNPYYNWPHFPSNTGCLIGIFISWFIIIYNPYYNWLRFHHLYTLNNGLFFGLKNGIQLLLDVFVRIFGQNLPTKRPPEGTFVGKARPNSWICWGFLWFFNGLGHHGMKITKHTMYKGNMFFSKHQTTKWK